MERTLEYYYIVILDHDCNIIYSECENEFRINYDLAIARDFKCMTYLDEIV